jgi:hypothetical protein
VWRLHGWVGLQHVWQGIAVLLAVGLALVPRRRDVVGLAASCAAVLIALQIGTGYWFYLYIVWFFPLVLVALLAGHGLPASPTPARHRPRAAVPARSTPRATALRRG